LKSWTDYLCPTLDGVLKGIQVPVGDEHITKMMVSIGHGNIVLEEEDEIYEKGDKFKSFHC